MNVLERQEWQGQVGVPAIRGDGMPLAIWLEFMSTPKRGVTSKRTASRKQRHSEAGESDEEGWKSEQNQDLKDLNIRRLKLLMMHTPSLTPQEFKQIPARAVYYIVWMMLRVGRFQDARHITQSYLAGLPPKLDPKAIRRSLNIIHLHIPWVFEKHGPLSQHYSARKIVENFLAIHRDIRPNATTLFLLIRSLRRTKNSGTLARQVAHAFCRRWGYRTESRQVRERIITYALREGNIDLAESELRKEMHSRFRERTYAAQAEVLGGTERMGYTRLLRQPMWKIYKQSGIDMRRWRYLVYKVRLLRAKAQSRGVNNDP